MATSAMFARAPARKGMYESFYLRAVSPEVPVGVWIRHTVHKPPGRPPRGSVWCTVFDGSRGRPFMYKRFTDAVSAPGDAWIEVGASPEQSGQIARMGAHAASGDCGPAAWSLEIEPRERELRHLPREWLYRAPLPRTKLTSPAPAALFDGWLRVASERELTLKRWPGMVGHNWGAEHAERWIWLHGVGFEEDASAWLDVALGRVRVAGRLSPWVANGALSLRGERLRIGGLGSRGLRVAESVDGCALRLPGERGSAVEVRAEAPAAAAAGWRYADPVGGAGHDVVNCSIASLELALSRPGEPAAHVLSSAHGGAYELGMRERDHGVPIAPFAAE
jgi:hypothetical protein